MKFEKKFLWKIFFFFWKALFKKIHEIKAKYFQVLYCIFCFFREKLISFTATVTVSKIPEKNLMDLLNQ